MERAGRPERVWAPDLIEGYCIGVIEDFGADSLTVRLLERPGQVGVLGYQLTYAGADMRSSCAHEVHFCVFYSSPVCGGSL